MTKTFYQIIGEKRYKFLTDAEKAQVQDRQNELVKAWKEETNEFRKAELFDELFDSLKGLIISKAMKEAERSYTVDQEDFEGLMNLVLIETLLMFDCSLGKPFQAIFLYNVNNEIKMMYRSKSKDVHDTTYESFVCRFDCPVPTVSYLTMGEVTESGICDLANVETEVFTDEVIEDCFGQDDKKRTIVHMSIQGFKRNEIVSAVNEGKSNDATARLVNRTVSQFKSRYDDLKQLNLSQVKSS